MASKMIQVCDFEEDEDTDVRALDKSRTFTWDGVQYEIDLCASHDIEFQAFLDQAERWKAAARPSHASSVPAQPARRRREPTSARRSENTAVRRWASEQGIEIGQRGRIPDSVRTQYREFLATDAGHRWSQAFREEEPPTEPEPSAPVTPISLNRTPAAVGNG